MRRKFQTKKKSTKIQSESNKQGKNLNLFPILKKKVFLDLFRIKKLKEKK